MTISYEILQLIITFFAAVLASSGFWYYIGKRMDGRDLNKKLLMGLAHDRITYLCLKYIDRGEVTQDEFENLNKYLYEPYKELGGNGTAEKLMGEVGKLPMCKSEYYVEKRRRRSKNENLADPCITE